MSPAAPQHRPRSNAARALAWMGGALAMFTIVAISGREAARVVNTQQIMMWRGFISLAIVVVVALVAGRTLRSLRSPAPHLHLVRNIAHFGAQFAWFYALTIIPLAELFALEFTAPLWVALLAPLLLAERLTGWRLMAVACGFAGAFLVVVMPSASRGVAFTLGTGSMFALLAALGFAIVQMTTKRLTRTDDAFAILAYMTAMQSVFSIAIAIFDGIIPGPIGMAWLVGMSAASLAAHFCVAKAFSQADAIIVAPMDFLRLPLIAVVGAQLYGETLDRWVLIGGLVVVAANLVNLWGEHRRSTMAR